MVPNGCPHNEDCSMSGRSGETARVVHVKLDINMCRISDIDKRPDQGREEDSDEREKRERKIRKVKRRLRSEISVSGGDWQRRRFAAVPRLLSTAGLKDRIPRVHIRDITMHEFVERFEKPRLPVILLGLCDDWPAYRKWSLDWFRDRYGESKFKLGTDDDGYAVRMKFKYYFSYLKDPVHAADDSPLYVFEGSFGDRAALAGLQDDYSVPEIFAEDLMQHVGERRRPPYKWVVIGPPRSGACLHVDPLSTHAWNALLRGRKRWALYPPGIPKVDLVPPDMEREASTWFHDVYPRTTGLEWPHTPPLDVVQGPGETIFVPCGWWHAVMNLDDTVAVTQNFVSTSNFAAAWRWTRKGRPKMSLKWLDALRKARPDLAAVADDIEQRKDYQGYPSASSSSSSSSSASDGSGD